MTKQEFLDKLRNGLSELPKKEIEDHLNFYAEMIDDRVEDGLTEEQAVSRVGNVNEIISQIKSETHSGMNKNSASKRKMKAWEIILLVLGSPIWLSLLVALISVIFSIYVVLWSVIVSFWAVFASCIACSVYGVISGVAFIFGTYYLTGVAMLGAGFFCAGLSIFLFFGCKLSTGGLVLLTKKNVACDKEYDCEKRCEQCGK